MSKYTKLINTIETHKTEATKLEGILDHLRKDIKTNSEGLADVLPLIEEMDPGLYRLCNELLASLEVDGTGSLELVEAIHGKLEGIVGELS